MSEPKVSIIIPTYNRADYIKQAIQSALDQPIQKLEVIAVDDGSTDATGELISCFPDPRLRYFYQANQGKGAAINHGFAASSGEYIGKLDSDDWYLPRVLPDLIRVLDENPELGVVAGGYKIVHQQGEPVEEVYPWVSRPELGLKTWVKGCPVLWQGALIRRAWFEKVGGFDTHIFGPDDWDFGIRLAWAGCSMRWVNKLIFNYRVHPNSSYKLERRYNPETLEILEKFFSNPDLSQEIMDEKQPAFLQAYINCAGRGYAAGQFEQAKRYLSNAIKLDPGLMCQNGKRLFFTIAWWARSPLLTDDPVSFVDNVVSNLPEEANKISLKRHRAQAELRAVTFFNAYESKEYGVIRRMARQFLIKSPWQFLNRGILSVSLKSLLWRRI